MCSKYKRVSQVAPGETVAHLFNALANFQEHAPSPGCINPSAGSFDSKAFGLVYSY